MKNLLFFILVLHAFTPLRAQTDSTLARTAKIQRFSFTGRVSDAASGAPLAGATVYFSDLKIGVATSSDGSFVFNGLPGGRHLLEITYVGYSGYSEYVDVRGQASREYRLTAEVVERNEVVVTGLSAATQARRAATPITTMRRQDLLRTSAVNIVDAMSKQPGVAQLSTGPAISKPVIRGLGYNRVITIHNGIRQEGQQWGDEHGLEIDEYSVSKVEILKGPASLMYGSDAMAGVVNIMSNIPPPAGALRGNFVSNYQTNNRLRGAGLNLGANHGNFSWNVSGSAKAAADYSNKYDSRVYNSKFNERNLGGYIGINGSWGFSHLSASYFKQNLGIVEGDRDDEGRFIKPVAGGGDELATEDDFNSTDPGIPWQSVQHTKLVSDNSFNIGKGRLALIAGLQRNQRIEYGNPDDPDERELYFDLGTFTYSAIYHLQDKNSWRTAIGMNGMAQRNRNKGEEVLIPEYSLFDIGGFAFSQKSWNDVTVSGGIRFDKRSIDSRAFNEGSEIKFAAFDKSFSNFSGSLGLSYLPNDLITLKFNVARGFRAPAIAELSSNGTHEGTNRYEYGDVNLKSETSLQFDAGFQLESEHISLEATLFSNNIDNFIFYRKLEAVGGGDSTVEVDGDFITAFRFDQRKARLAGLELSVDIHPHPLDWLHFENTFSFVNARFREAIEGSKNIPFIPAARLISEVRADFLQKGKLFRNLSLNFEFDRTFDQDRAFTAYETETATPGYTLLNAGAAVDIVSKSTTLFTIYFHANNIADEAYQHHLNRLKYAAENIATGRRGVFNMGRNFSIKINVPISATLRKNK